MKMTCMIDTSLVKIRKEQEKDESAIHTHTLYLIRQNDYR